MAPEPAPEEEDEELRRRRERRRTLAGWLVALVVVGVAAGAYARTRPPDAHALQVDMPSAAGLVPGSDVDEAGVRVGTVADISPLHDSHALVALAIDDDHWPLHARGLRVGVRPKSLLGEKYVDIHNGDAAGPTYAASDRPLTADATSVPVEIDQFINSLDDATRTSARVLLSDLGAGLAGRGADVNDAIRTARDNLAHLAITGQTLDNRDPELDRIVVSLDAALGKLTQDDQLTQLSSLIHTGRETLDAVEAERAAFSRQFVDAQAALADLNAAVEPAVASLRDTLATAPHLLSVLTDEANLLAQLETFYAQPEFIAVNNAGISHGPTASGGAVENLPDGGRVPIFRICTIAPGPGESGTLHAPQSGSSCTGNGFPAPAPDPPPATAASAPGDGLAGMLGFLQA